MEPVTCQNGTLYIGGRPFAWNTSPPCDRAATSRVFRGHDPKPLELCRRHAGGFMNFYRRRGQAGEFRVEPIA